MNTSTQHNIGGYVVAVTSVFPQGATANINGAAINRLAHGTALSCVLHQVTGPATGAPTSLSAQAKLQHSPDGITWSDYIAPGTSAAAQTPVLTTANSESSAAIDLTSAQAFIRAVALVAFTGGSSPMLTYAADIVLGGETIASAV